MVGCIKITSCLLFALGLSLLQLKAFEPLTFPTSNECETFQKAPHLATPISEKELPAWAKLLQKESFEFQFLCTKVIFWIAISMSVIGFGTSLYILCFDKIQGRKPKSSKEEISILSIVTIKGTGAFVLAFSLLFLYLYARYVYPLMTLTI